MSYFKNISSEMLFVIVENTKRTVLLLNTNSNSKFMGIFPVMFLK